MKLVLQSQYLKLAKYQSPFARETVSKAVTVFGLAAVVTGVNYYFQNFIAKKQNQRQKQLIDRVSNEQTAEDFLHKFNYHKADDWQYKKITLDGTLKDGRFLVKRNRGNEQGYIVLAPFTVQRDRSLSVKRKVQRKFVLNMGWIPKHSKHLVKTLAAADTIGENQYTAENRIEAMQKQRYDNLLRDPNDLSAMSTITTVDVYVRRGQKEEVLNGLTNWKNSKFYKYIDLPWICRLFRISNQSQANTVYLERISKSQQDAEVVPIPTRKSHVIDDIKERIELNNKNRDRNILGVGLVSGISAVILAIL